jgi:hypothetical protein
MAVNLLESLIRSGCSAIVLFLINNNTILHCFLLLKLFIAGLVLSIPFR